MKTLETDVISAWEQCPARDKEGKEYYWQLYKNTRRLKAILMGYVQGGKAVKLDGPQRGVIANMADILRMRNK